MTLIQGNIHAPQATHSHTQPETALQDLVADGTQQTFNVGGFINTGNVTQTLRFGQNAQVEGLKVVGIHAKTDGEPSDSVQVAPGQEATCIVTVEVANEAVETPDRPYSIELSPIWS